MTMYVLVEHTPGGKVTASLIGRPTIEAQGENEEEALAYLRQSLTARLEQAKIVPLDLAAVSPPNPWLELAGIFKDDPFFDEVQASIAAYRHELDAEDDAA